MNFFFSINQCHFNYKLESKITSSYLPNINMNANLNTCAICLENIEDLTVNCLTTECRHHFHTKCMMNAMAHSQNFVCPCCRGAMADELEYSDESDSDDDDDDDDDDYSGDESEGDVSRQREIRRIHAQHERLYQENANLQSVRWLFQRNLGEELDDEPLEPLEEGDYESDAYEDEDEEDEEERPKPDVQYLVHHLQAQGIGMEQLVKGLLLEHPEYEDDEEISNMNDDVFGKLRVLITNYQPPLPPSQPLPVPVPVPEEEPPSTDDHPVDVVRIAEQDVKTFITLEPLRCHNHTCIKETVRETMDKLLDDVCERCTPSAIL